MRSGEPSLLIAATRAFLPPDTRTEEQLQTGLAVLLKTAAAELLKNFTSSTQNKYGAPRELYCVVRAPWTDSQTLTADQYHEKPVHITDALIASMAKKALAFSKEQTT